MTAIRKVEASAYRLPVDPPESDGTLSWDHTTVVVAEIGAGTKTGLGATYGPVACVSLIQELLSDHVVGLDPFDIPRAWSTMVEAIRNVGRPGVASMAIAAIEIGLWDLKAKLLDLPLFRLLGAVRDEVPVYASGGFASMDEADLSRQLGGWADDDGFPRVKMKIGVDGGKDPYGDLDRVSLARKAIGPDVELFVDANGAYGRKEAIRVARSLAMEGVTWFEEPVSSDDLDGLREVREAVEQEVAAGEYAYDAYGFARLVPVVDVLQADASRCAGFHGWMQAAALAASSGLEVSGHTAQSLHLHLACAVPNVRHLEYFADHARADRLLFDGVIDPVAGTLRPDPDRPGLGLKLRRTDAERFRKG